VLNYEAISAETITSHLSECAINKRGVQRLARKLQNIELPPANDETPSILASEDRLSNQQQMMAFFNDALAREVRTYLVIIDYLTAETSKQKEA
jgi:hypothetical protein